MPKRDGDTHENSKDEYGTPEHFMDPEDGRSMKNIIGFDLDPAAGAERHETATTRWENNGKANDWHGKVWLNPPFSEKTEWIDKALLEHAKENTEVIVMLLPECTADGWFHEYASVMDMVCFVDGRVSFDGGGSSPAGGIQLWALINESKPWYRNVKRVFQDKGEVWEP